MDRPEYLKPEDRFAGPEFEANAQATYEAYGKNVGGTTWDGKPIPSWEEIQPRQRNGWRAACAKCLQNYLEYEKGCMESLAFVVNPLEDPRDAKPGYSG